MMWLCMIYAARHWLCMWLGCDVGGSLCAFVAQGRSLMRGLFISWLHCWFHCYRYMPSCMLINMPFKQNTKPFLRKTVSLSREPAWPNWLALHVSVTSKEQVMWALPAALPTAGRNSGLTQPLHHILTFLRKLHFFFPFGGVRALDQPCLLLGLALGGTSPYPPFSSLCPIITLNLGKCFSNKCSPLSFTLRPLCNVLVR